MYEKGIALKKRREYKRQKKRITTSKLAMWFIFWNCAAVELYSMVAMWHFGDLSALYALLGAVVGQSITYISYNNKSCRENSRGGITYETAMSEPTNINYSDTNNDICG